MAEAAPARMIAAVGGGLALGALCAGAGFLVIGMGHGWDYPAQAGILTLLFYPLALVRRLCIERETAWRRDAILTALIAIPIALVLSLAGPLPNPLGFPIEGWAIILGGAGLYLAIGALLARAQLHAAWGDAVLLGCGVALDIAAFADHATSMWRNTGGVLIMPWLVLWIGWQVVAAGALVRHLRAQPVTA